MNFINSIILKFLKNSYDVLLLSTFFLFLFAVIGLQFFMGLLTQKCIKIPPENISPQEYLDHLNNQENWEGNGQTFFLCGNSSSSRPCPENYTCFQGFGPNPDYGYTNFDHIGWSFLALVRLMAQDNWDVLYTMVLQTAGFWHITFFAVPLFFCSYYMTALIISRIVATFYQVWNAKPIFMEMDFEGTSNTEVLAVEPGKKEKGEEMQQKASLMTKAKTLCQWQCCGCWVKFQHMVSSFMFHPFMEVFTTLVIFLNVLAMALDQSDMEEDLALSLSCIYFACSIFIVLEAILKIIALGPKLYFTDRWNLFEFFLVVATLLEFVVEVRGLSLLRLFRLARPWPRFREFLDLLGQSLSWMLLILISFILIFALVGSQLYQTAYVTHQDRFPLHTVPEWNFTTMMHSFMVVVRVLARNWMDVMFDCVLVAGWSCLPYFLTLVILGNLSVLLLVLTLVVPAEKKEPFTDNDNSRRIKEAYAIIRGYCASVFGLSIKIKEEKHEQVQNGITTTDHPDYEVLKLTPVSDDVSDASVPVLQEETGSHNQEEPSPDIQNEQNSHSRPSTPSPAVQSVTVALEEPPNCCPTFFYKWKRCCVDENSPLGQKWRKCRMCTLKLLNHTIYKVVICLVVFLSALILAFEDIHLPHRYHIKWFIYSVEIIVMLIFIAELLLKCLGYGILKYFSAPQGWLEFVLVLTSISYLAKTDVSTMGQSACSVLVVFRALRAIRLMYMVPRIQVVTSAIWQILKATSGVIAVCFMCWLCFAICGVQLFALKFYHCTDVEGTVINATAVPDKLSCLLMNFTWANSPTNFENVLNAFVALFQVATFSGWTEIVNHATSSSGLLKQPVPGSNNMFFIYFFLFILMVLLNLTFLVVYEARFFTHLQQKVGGYLAIFMTEDQKKRYNTAINTRFSKPEIPPPQLKFLGFAYSIVTSKWFDATDGILVLSYLCLVASDYYDIPEYSMNVIEIIFKILLAAFVIVFILRVCGLRYHYFKDPLNIVDIIVIPLAVLGLILRGILALYVVAPCILLFLRIFRTGRMFNTLGVTKKLYITLCTMASTLPCLYNIVLFVFIIMYFYAVVGMSFFKSIEERYGVDAEFNFKTFGSSIVLLLPMSHAAGWDDIYHAVTNEMDCYPSNDDFPGTCGSKFLGTIYTVSYVAVIQFIAIVAFVILIAESLSQVKNEKPVPVRSN